MVEAAGTKQDCKNYAASELKQCQKRVRNYFKSEKINPLDHKDYGRCFVNALDTWALCNESIRGSIDFNCLERPSCTSETC
jgi:hypothetical protein